MNILINGILGQMGREVAALCERGYRGAALAAGVDVNAQSTEGVYSSWGNIAVSGIDCIIDFSHHSAVGALLDFAVTNSVPTVIATTGHTDGELADIHRAARYIPIFFSANMSLGVALLVELARTAALAMPDAEVEIIEKHHDKKIDAPSGTALMIAKAIRDIRPEAYVNSGRCGLSRRTQSEIGIHAVRIGNMVGQHEVLIGTQNQTITLKHEAHSRILFAEGALAAAEFIIGCDVGLYDMKSLVSGDRECAHT